MGVSQKGCKYRKNFYKILKILTHIFEENAHFELVPALLDGINNQIESALDLGDLAGTALDDGIDGVTTVLRVERHEEGALEVGRLANPCGIESAVAVNAVFAARVKVEVVVASVFRLIKLPHGQLYFQCGSAESQVLLIFPSSLSHPLTANTSPAAHTRPRIIENNFFILLRG